MRLQAVMLLQYDMKFVPSLTDADNRLIRLAIEQVCYDVLRPCWF